MKIISYNVEFAKSTTPKNIALHLESENPDIICFAEVPNGDWTSLVGEYLGMSYSYVGEIASANHEEEYADKTGKYYGKFKSILSKTPLIKKDEKRLKGKGWSPVSIVLAETMINGNRLLIGSLHIPSGKAYPLDCCAADLAILMDDYSDNNIIITGDYNDLANSSPMQSLYKKGFKNSWLTTNFKLINEKTWDSKSEKDAGVIDHFLYRGALKAIESKIIKSESPESDHYAIVATF